MSENRKLAAILVADVVGYSRLAGANETHAGTNGRFVIFSFEILEERNALGIARPSALHYRTDGTRGSPPDRPTIAGSVSSRDVEEIRKSLNPGTPGDVKLSNCMSST